MCKFEWAGELQWILFVIGGTSNQIGWIGIYEGIFIPFIIRKQRKIFSCSLTEYSKQ